MREVRAVRRPTLVAALVLALALVAVGAVGLGRHLGAQSADAASPTSLPHVGAAQAVERDDVGDPFVLTVPHGVAGHPDARYVLFWTTDWRSNVPTAISSDLVHWQRIDDALPQLPSWAVPSRTMTWGPSAIPVAGGWELYYSTQERGSHLECIGRAFSTNAAGPYVDNSSAPLICQRAIGGDIDPSVTRDSTGRPSLVWKNDGNARQLPTSIWQQSLSTDGSTLVGSAHRLLGVDASWEDGIVEGPAMLAASMGGYWLFFSGGAWQSNTYDTGVAWCATISGPCHDAAPAPILASRQGAVSPGGLDTFVDVHGRRWASYSAFPEQPASLRAAMAEDRVLEIAPLTGF